jgi:hypothetical protein
MNEDNFSIDITAEKKAFSEAISVSELSMENVTTQQLKVELPESLPIRPTAIPLEVSVSPDYAKSALDLSVKFDAETKYTELNSRISSLQRDMESVGRETGQGWLPNPQAKNNFEERPTTDPTNLIFINRRERFGSYPRWG